MGTHEGILADGTRYLLAVPRAWDRYLLLYSYGPPVAPGAPPWPADQPVVQALLRRGYAIAGCATTRFWPLAENVGNQVAVADVFAETVGPPERTAAWGNSIGGIELVDITEPPRNVSAAVAVLDEAQRSPQGRARISLAASLATVPGWYDPGTPAPTAHDHAAWQHGQYQWLREPDLMVFLGARAVLEERGGGNPSWNTGVDYRRLLSSSIGAQHTAALYAEDHELPPTVAAPDRGHSRHRTPPAFVAHEPPPMPRAYDVRHARGC